MRMGPNHEVSAPGAGPTLVELWPKHGPVLLKKETCTNYPPSNNGVEAQNNPIAARESEFRGRVAREVFNKSKLEFYYRMWTMRYASALAFGSAATAGIAIEKGGWGLFISAAVGTVGTMAGTRGHKKNWQEAEAKANQLRCLREKFDSESRDTDGDRNRRVGAYETVFRETMYGTDTESGLDLRLNQVSASNERVGCLARLGKLVLSPFGGSLPGSHNSPARLPQIEVTATQGDQPEPLSVGQAAGALARAAIRAVLPQWQPGR